MNIVDSFNASQKLKIPDSAVAVFQKVLTKNIEPGFQSQLYGLINSLMERTGSCVMIPGGNVPPLCREGIKQAEELQDDETLIFIPIIHNVFGVKENPGDPLVFCIVSNTIPGVKFEWEGLWQAWKQNRVDLPQTDAKDMRIINRHIERELLYARREYAREKKHVKSKS